MTEHSDRLRVGDHVVIFARGRKKLYTAEVTLADSQRSRRGLKTSNRKLAVQLAQKLEAEVLAGQFQIVKSKRVTLTDAKAEFIDFKRTDGRAHKTLVKYEGELDGFVAWCKDQNVVYLDQLNARLHDRYRAHRGKGIEPTTMHHLTIIHKTFTRWCVSRDLIQHDPLRKVQSRRPPRDVVFVPSLAQVRAVVQEAEGHAMHVLATLALAGLRVGEAVHLRRRDVDLDGGWLHVVNRTDSRTKTGRSRKVPISSVLRDVLKDVKPEVTAPFVFSSPTTKPRLAINLRDPNQWLRKIAKHLGLPVGRKDQGLVVHSLRHFFRTHSTNAGVPTYVIDEWMGHVGERTTGKLYFHLTDEASQQWMQRVDFGAPLVSKGDSSK